MTWSLENKHSKMRFPGDKPDHLDRNLSKLAREDLFQKAYVESCPPAPNSLQAVCLQLCFQRGCLLVFTGLFLHCSLLNTLKQFLLTEKGSFQMYHPASVISSSRLGRFARQRSCLSPLHAHGPQAVPLCNACRLDKAFLGTLMGLGVVFVLAPEFRLSSFVWALLFKDSLKYIHNVLEVGCPCC